MNRDDIERYHDYGIYVPHRKIYSGSETYGDDDESGVDGLMAERLTKNINILESLSSEPIVITLNSPGGDWNHGMNMYDSIKAAKSHITVLVQGMAMSMGAVILQAADERVVSPSAKIMVHYGTMGIGETHAKIFEKWAEESKKINAEMERILLEKIHEKHPNFSLKKLKDMLNFDTILSAREAVDLGLADKILGDDSE